MERTDNLKLLPDEVYENLLNKIVNKEWKIGDRIPSENALCKEYGVSRVSVRAALQKLQAQNMVITRPGRGTFVLSNRTGENAISMTVGKMDLSKNEFRYVVELRKAIEFTAVELMVKYGHPEDFERLHDALEQMRDCGGDVEKYVKADYDFHWAIILGSHNPLFASVMNGLKDVLMRYFQEMAAVSNGNFSRAIQNHTQIYESLISRNAEHVKRVIGGTFEYNLVRFRNAFKEEEGETEQP